MRNGIRFNKLRMVGSDSEQVDDASAYYPYQSGVDSGVSEEAPASVKTTLIVFTAVSIACATAAIAAGSYATWLSRQQAARQALTDVNDILKSCQTRMHQLEADVQRLPNRPA